MKTLEKVYLIFSNYLCALFIIPIGFEMLPTPLNLAWVGFNIYLWLASPLIAVLGDKKETASSLENVKTVLDLTRPKVRELPRYNTKQRLSDLFFQGHISTRQFLETMRGSKIKRIIPTKRKKVIPTIPKDLLKNAHA